MMRRVGVLVAGFCAVLAMTSPSATAAESEPDDMVTVAGWGKIYEWSPGHASGKRLDYAVKAQAVDIWNDNNKSNQRWQTYSYGNNWYAFRNMSNMECLRYEGRGKQMTTIPCDDSNSYKFKGVKSGGYWTFRPMNAQNLCMEVRSRGTSNGSHVTAWNCNGDSHQRWKATAV
ncbi:RICIN domain-containing protein [Saccharothrix deserti]|uniref:RICIN domain-containing protein n=1 Tax=Saccharothrix deserti TaxID=2593674 RepID=UPI00131A81C9|nr:RICIN domain-containing protein [Saccharothrix deserti]